MHANRMQSSPKPCCHPETETRPQPTGSVDCQRDAVLMWPTWSLPHRSGLDSKPSGTLSARPSSSGAQVRPFDRRMSSLRWGNVIQFRDGRHLDALGRGGGKKKKNAEEADVQNEPMPSLGDVYRDKFLLGN